MEKKKAEINVTNVKAFISGMSRKYYNDLIGLPEHLQEQVAYRKSKCPDCAQDGECKVCGCSLPGKWFVTKSCNNGERFPDIMDKAEWEEFKKKEDERHL